VIRPKIYYDSQTALICLENTVNMWGGTVYPTATVDEICDGAHAMGLKVHLDGARIFNASVALGIPVHEIASPADTVMFCLSKGLGAPVGSILAGPADLIAKGRLYRKRLGGGMRQAGILAAAGIYALERNVERLREDHDNARLLADALGDVPGVRLRLPEVPTNIVLAECPVPAVQVAERAAAAGVLVTDMGGPLLRLMTYLGVSSDDVREAAGRLHGVLAQLAA